MDIAAERFNFTASQFNNPHKVELFSSRFPWKDSDWPKLDYMPLTETHPGGSGDALLLLFICLHL